MKKNHFLALLAALFFLAVGDYFFKISWPLRQAVEVVVVPVREQLFSVGSIFRVITFWKTGEERIKNLENRNRELVLQTAKIKELEQENQALMSQYGLAQKKRLTLLPAKVISISGGLQVSRGSNDGVKSGQAVIIDEALVGVIGQVYPKWAKVVTPVMADFKVPAKDGDVMAVVEGQFGTAAYLDMVPSDRVIVVGDTVSTSGADGTLPPSLIIGKISSIESKETDVFKKARLELVVDKNKLSNVFVVLDW